MTNKRRIARRDMPRLPFGENGESRSEIAAANPQRIAHEKTSIVFRKEYTFTDAPAEAIIRICGLGFYHLYIDGKRLGISPLPRSVA